MTQISATSTSPGRHRLPDAGVTLVEVLVVLALIGILAGVVGLSFGSGPRGDVAGQEADLLVARLNRAADEVILTGVPLGLSGRPKAIVLIYMMATDGRRITCRSSPRRIYLAAASGSPMRRAAWCCRATWTPVCPGH